MPVEKASTLFIYFGHAFSAALDTDLHNSSKMSLYIITSQEKFATWSAQSLLSLIMTPLLKARQERGIDSEVGLGTSFSRSFGPR